MQLKNAIRKLERAGYKPEGNPGNPFWRYGKGKCVIDLGCNPAHEDGSCDVVIIDARLRTDKDEPESDLHAGTFCDSIAGAIKFCDWLETIYTDQDAIEKYYNSLMDMMMLRQYPH